MKNVNVMLQEFLSDQDARPGPYRALAAKYFFSRHPKVRRVVTTRRATTLIKQPDLMVSDDIISGSMGGWSQRMTQEKVCWPVATSGSIEMLVSDVNNFVRLGCSAPLA